MEGSADKAGKRFPIGRTLIALVIVSIFTPGIMLVPATLAGPQQLYGLMFLPLASIMLAWPGCLTFLALGLPTLYWLFRTNHTGFIIFAFFGALYTALAWDVFQVIAKQREQLHNFVPIFVVIIGLINLNSHAAHCPWIAAVVVKGRSLTAVSYMFVTGCCL
jgi:hypothetical protein